MNGAEGQTSWLTDAALLGAVPGLAYLFGYAFEMGYATHFLIPRDIVTVDLARMFRVAFPVLVAITLPLAVLDASSLLLDGPGRKALTALVRPFYPLVGVCAIAALLLGRFQSFWYWLLGVAVLAPLLELLAAVIKKRRTGGWRARMSARVQEWEEKRTAIGRLLGLKGYVVPLALVSMFIALAMFYEAGECAAMAKHEFSVLQGSETTVVLRMYGDHIVCGVANPKEHELEETRIILREDRARAIVFHREELGRLKVKPALMRTEAGGSDS